MSHFILMATYMKCVLRLDASGENNNGGPVLFKT
ncbi:hypothetical protein BH23BAC2_BH23BAC2_22510 [soil metagenome]